jgi:hypothetical protein
MTEEERIKALEDKLLKVVRALIDYTKSGSSTKTPYGPLCVRRDAQPVSSEDKVAPI